MTPESDRIEAEIRRLGLTLERCGQAYRVRGTGVDLVVARLQDVNLSELRPGMPAHRRKSPRAARGAS